MFGAKIQFEHKRMRSMDVILNGWVATLKSGLIQNSSNKEMNK